MPHPEPEPLCPDCQVAIGEHHHDGCDTAHCALTGRQRLTCGHGEDDEACRSTWSGLWPGDAECREWDWWAREVPGMGLVPCPADAPGASEDTNRLVTAARWDPAAQRYQRI